MSDTTKQPRRGFLAGLSASLATPAVAGEESEHAAAEPRASEPASIIPEGPPRTRYFVEANPVLRVVTLYCSAGPRGGDGSNIMAQIAFAPDQARTIAHHILQQLEGFEAECERMEAMGYGELRLNGGKSE